MADHNPEKHTTPPDGRPLDEQPRWRRDFPIDWAQDEFISRRDLIKFISLTSLAFVSGQFFLLGSSAVRREPAMPAMAIADVDELQVGESRAFGYPNDEDQRLLVRTGEDTFVAYDQKCTHLLCPVFARFEEGTLHCPCHNGYFDLETGRPIAGPPRRPLPKVHLEIRDGTVYATGVEARTV